MTVETSLMPIVGEQLTSWRIAVSIVTLAGFLVTASVLAYTFIKRTAPIEDYTDPEESRKDAIARAVLQERLKFVSTMRRVTAINLIALGLLVASEMVRILYIPPFGFIEPTWAAVIFLMRPYVVILHIALPSVVLFILLRRPK